MYGFELGQFMDAPNISDKLEDKDLTQEPVNTELPMPDPKAVSQ
jgi:hypothetical protein